MEEERAHHDYWGTPQNKFDIWDKEFNFTLDPCADPRRLLKQGITNYTIDDNGLEQSWAGYRVFCNPPYSKGQLWDWVRKAYSERNRAQVIVMLLPVRTDRKAFHKYIYNICEIRFQKGRLGFVNLDTNKQHHKCKHASMLCIYRKNNQTVKPTQTRLFE